MFYQGSLQQAISTAVDQQKLVLCFVTNENDESQTWENDYLQHDTLREAIVKHAIALRLMAGSEEAGYLHQLFPLPQTPVVVIMKHGALKEYIAAGTTKEDFFSRVQCALGVVSRTESGASSASPSLPAAATPAAVPPTTDGSPSSRMEQIGIVMRLLEERAARLRAAKEEAERKARAERDKKKAQGAAPTTSKHTQEQTEMLKKAKQKAAEERRRILKRIQDDKEERRQQAQERKQKRLQTQATSQAASSPRSSLAPQSKSGEFTSIQVRLLDGSTIRTRFKTASPIKEMRQWVEEKTPDLRIPFGFKQLLTPLPNRTIDQTEEDKSFSDVGLSPSSTLVLLPIHDYATAYRDTSQGIWARVLASITAFFCWLLGCLGVGSRREAPEQQSSVPAVQSKKSAVKGLGDTKDRQKDQQLYNGNSLNFEPRPEDEEKE